jgi:hypothetical protein
MSKVKGVSNVCALKELEPGHSARMFSRPGVVSGLRAGTPCEETPRGLTDTEVSRAVGLVKSQGGLCLHALEWAKAGSEVQMWSCFLTGPQSSHQLWSFDGFTGHLKNQAGMCLRASRGDREFDNITIEQCNDDEWAQKWSYDSTTGILKMKHGLCLHAAEQGRQGGALYMRACDAKNPKQLWSIGSASDILTDDPSVHPRHSMRASMFCFALMQPDSYEQQLLKFQSQQQTNIFGCDAYAIYSNRVIPIDDGVETHVVDSTLKCGMGGEFGTALNLDIFIVVWNKVIEEGTYLQSNWTVKSDPDSVFLPERLRVILSIYQEEKTGIYMNNCKYGLHGPLEVFSANAVTAWGNGYKQCQQHFEEKCKGDCMWGEDLFVDQCLWKVLGARRVSDFRLILEDHCDPPEDWQTCSDPSIAAFHPFKNVSSYTQCMNAANAIVAQGGGGENPLDDPTQEPDQGYCPSVCHNAVEGEECFQAVQWVMQIGVKDHPEWYAGLSRGSTAEQVQGHLHLLNEALCPQPCGPCTEPAR